MVYERETKEYEVRSPYFVVQSFRVQYDVLKTD